jgi:hypothetical protein
VTAINRGRKEMRYLIRKFITGSTPTLIRDWAANRAAKTKSSTSPHFLLMIRTTPQINPAVNGAKSIRILSSSMPPRIQ